MQRLYHSPVGRAWIAIRENEIAAASVGVPVVAVTETQPANVTFQDWMLGELDALDKALTGPNS